MLPNKFSVFQEVRSNLHTVDDPDGHEGDDGEEESGNGTIDPGG